VDVTAIVPLPDALVARPEAVSLAMSGQSPLVRIVRELSAVASVVVAAASELVVPARELLAAAGFSQGSSRVCVVEAQAPGDRAQCVAAGLSEAGIHVLIHDIGWPLVDSGVAGQVIAALRAGAPVVAPARPVTDTIKTVDPQGNVTATVDRATLQVLQYPRGFTADVLADVLARHGAGEQLDELRLAMGHIRVELIPGDPGAFEVELPRDADYLAAVIDVRQHGSAR